MITVLALCLAGAMAGLPLATALTATTASLAGTAAVLALAGLFTHNPALLTGAIIVGLVEELLALMQAGTPTDLVSPVLLGIVMSLLLDVGAFARTFRGVHVDRSVLRMKLAYWGWTSVLWGVCGVSLGIIAAGVARPVSTPILLHLLAAAAAAMTIGAILLPMRSGQR